MAINTPQQEKAAVGFHTTTATTINELNFLSANRNDKARFAFRSSPAWRGRTLLRIDPIDGPATYCSERLELMLYPDTIYAARRLTEQIGGWL